MLAAADIDLAAARKTVEAMAGTTNRALAIEADCGDVASIDAMVAKTVAEFGRLDIIVNNAGVNGYAYVMDLTDGIGIASTGSTPRVCSSACSARRRR